MNARQTTRGQFQFNFRVIINGKFIFVNGDSEIIKFKSQNNFGWQFVKRVTVNCDSLNLYCVVEG